MPLTIPDEILQSAGLSEAEARVEIACRRFDAEKLSLRPAAKWVGMSRGQFEDELLRRKIPIYRTTLQDLDDDLNALDRLGL
jgi:predicted HTH domain antitoxin